MQEPQPRYTGYYNRKNKKVGHLFSRALQSDLMLCWNWYVIYISIRDGCGFAASRTNAIA
jgi:hypothetical protein